MRETLSVIGDPFPNSAIRPTENKNQKHTLFAMFILYGSRPICNEHLEGQRDDLSYITAKVGTVSAASRAETLMLKDNIPVPTNHRLITGLMRFLLMDVISYRIGFTHCLMFEFTCDLIKFFFILLGISPLGLSQGPERAP